jgi:hypothetical protein
MKPLRVGIAFFVFMATGCGSPGNQSFGPPASHAAKGWSILYSPSMPSTPTAGGPGTWYFDFPTDPNYPACVYNPDTLCHSVNYVTNSYTESVSHNVSMTFQILTTGAPTFNYMMETGNTCATSATVRLFLERKNDDLSQEFYRWWANSAIYDLQPTSENVTMTVPLTPDQWSSVYGKPGNLNATTLAGFHDALTNLGHVGMTFGGGCFAGHGVNVSGGSARFALISYSIS